MWTAGSSQYRRHSSTTDPRDLAQEAALARCEVLAVCPDAPDDLLRRVGENAAHAWERREMRGSGRFGLRADVAVWPTYADFDSHLGAEDARRRGGSVATGRLAAIGAGMTPDEIATLERPDVQTAMQFGRERPCRIGRVQAWRKIAEARAAIGGKVAGSVVRRRVPRPADPRQSDLGWAG